MPEYDPSMSASRYTIYSSDPNDHYRKWLEKNVGKQGWDWNWNIGKLDNNSILIKVRSKFNEQAVIMALMWS
jgi:hypothetical protein